MEFLQSILSQPFTWGLLVGIALFLWACLGHFKTKREFGRYKGMLNQKLELESESQEQLRNELKSLRTENENLRFKVNQLKEKPAASQQRDLEIMARAEQQMMVAAPGFAGAWEQAKMRARQEIETEESGKSLPRRIFKQLMGGGSASPKLTAPAEVDAEAVETPASADAR